MELKTDTAFSIDIEDVIRKKNARLLKAIPCFAISYLKRIIHQDEMNLLLKQNEKVTGLNFVRNSLDFLSIRYQIFGFENIPSSGRFIFASNHPLGGLDGMVLLDSIGKQFPDVKFVVNDLLMHVKNLDSVFVPVNKHGRQSSSYARLIDEAYSSNTQILFFPAGMCSRKLKGTVTDLVWHKSFITKSVKYQRDVIPVYFEGRNSNFFYNLAKLRAFLGLKVNLEMLYLVDEMFKQRNRSLKLVFGKPISYKTFNSLQTPSDWANEVRRQVYSLKANL